ncbi:hypothetical protein bcgnr5388_48530 [Bacillus cereus]
MKMIINSNLDVSKLLSNLIYELYHFRTKLHNKEYTYEKNYAFKISEYSSNFHFNVSSLLRFR